MPTIHFVKNLLIKNVFESPQLTDLTEVIIGLDLETQFSTKPPKTSELVFALIGLYKANDANKTKIVSSHMNDKNHKAVMN
jgi:hypothetical protein